MSQAVFERTKPHINLITIGHTGHGKTTLTAALSRVITRTYGGEENSFEQIATSHHAEYDTATRHYAHADYPSDDLNTRLTGDVKFDGAILVVAVTEGLMPQTSEHIQMARQAGVPYIAVFLNQFEDVDEEALELLKMEVCELLSNNDYPGDDVYDHIVCGSSLKALEGDGFEEVKIRDISAVLDSIPLP